MRLESAVAAAMLAFSLGACTPQLNPRGAAVQAPEMRADAFVVEDGAVLPYRRWQPADAADTRAVIVALHGFNDHSRAWDMPAQAWAARGIALYAYDQRGFGQAPQPGIWAGGASLVADLASVHALVAARHAGVPIFVAGESMGGAVAMLSVFSIGGLLMQFPIGWLADRFDRERLLVACGAVAFASSCATGVGAPDNRSPAAARVTIRPHDFFRQQ